MGCAASQTLDSQEEEDTSTASPTQGTQNDDVNNSQNQNSDVQVTL